MSKIIAKMAFFGIEFERFNAVDGELLKSFSKQHINSPLLRSGAYIGCTLSHLSIIQDAKKNDYERILVLEDDVIIHKDFINLFDKLVKSLIETGCEWDINYMGHLTYSEYFDNNDRDTLKVKKMYDLPFTKILSDRTSTWGLHCIAYNNEPNNIYGKILRDYEKDFTMEYDRYILKSLAKDEAYRILISYPQLMYQNFDNDNVSDLTGQAGWLMEQCLHSGYSSIKDYI